MDTDSQHGATWDVSSYESDKPGVKPSTFVSFAFRYRSPGSFFSLCQLGPYSYSWKEFLEAQGIASMEQTQPWVAHTRRFTQRAVSLPIRLPMPLNATDSVTGGTPSSSTNSTPLIEHPLTKIDSLPLMALTPDPLLGEMGPPATPASTSSDLNDSPEQLIGQLPPLNSRSSTPLQSESDGESRKMSLPDESSPTESEPDKSLGRLGKGKAPVIWRPWIHPVGMRPTLLTIPFSIPM